MGPWSSGYDDTLTRCGSPVQKAKSSELRSESPAGPTLSSYLMRQ